MSFDRLLLIIHSDYFFNSLALSVECHFSFLSLSFSLNSYVRCNCINVVQDLSRCFERKCHDLNQYFNEVFYQQHDDQIRSRYQNYDK